MSVSNKDLTTSITKDADYTCPFKLSTRSEEKSYIKRFEAYMPPKFPTYIASLINNSTSPNKSQNHKQKIFSSPEEIQALIRMMVEMINYKDATVSLVQYLAKKDRCGYYKQGETIRFISKNRFLNVISKFLLFNEPSQLFNMFNIFLAYYKLLKH